LPANGAEINCSWNHVLESNATLERVFELALALEKFNNVLKNGNGVNATLFMPRLRENQSAFLLVAAGYDQLLPRFGAEGNGQGSGNPTNFPMDAKFAHEDVITLAILREARQNACCLQE